jgi:hypothetical protein
MQSAPLPENEASRLRDLQQYHILDTPPEAAFNDLTALAAQICGTPIALVSLIDAQETPRDIAFCAHAIHGNDLFVVPDATQDRRFADNPLVATDPNIRFYAGMPPRHSRQLRTGHPLCDRSSAETVDWRSKGSAGLLQAVTRLLPSTPPQDQMLAKVGSGEPRTRCASVHHRLRSNQRKKRAA